MATHQPSQHQASPPPHLQNPRQPSGRRNLQLAPAIAIASNTFRLVTESNVPNSHLVSRWKQISPARLTSVFIARLRKSHIREPSTLSKLRLSPHRWLRNRRSKRLRSAEETLGAELCITWRQGRRTESRYRGQEGARWTAAFRTARPEGALLR